MKGSIGLVSRTVRCQVSSRGHLVSSAGSAREAPYIGNGTRERRTLQAHLSRVFTAWRAIVAAEAGRRPGQLADQGGHQRAAAQAAGAAAPPHTNLPPPSGGSGRQGACSSLSSPQRLQSQAGRHPAGVGRAQAWMGGRSAGAAGEQLPRPQPATAGRGRAALLEAWRACLSQKPVAGRAGVQQGRVVMGEGPPSKGMRGCVRRVGHRGAGTLENLAWNGAWDAGSGLNAQRRSRGTLAASRRHRRIPHAHSASFRFCSGFCARIVCSTVA